MNVARFRIERVRVGWELGLSLSDLGPIFFLNTDIDFHIGATTHVGFH
jgi:hypothetical protein